MPRCVSRCLCTVVDSVVAGSCTCQHYIQSYISVILEVPGLIISLSVIGEDVFLSKLFYLSLTLFHRSCLFDNVKWIRHICHSCSVSVAHLVYCLIVVVCMCCLFLVLCTYVAALSHQVFILSVACIVNRLYRCRRLFVSLFVLDVVRTCVAVSELPVICVMLVDFRRRVCECCCI